MPGARCTRGLVCREIAHRRTRAYRAAETLRHPLRNGFTAYFVLSPVSEFVLSPSPAKTSRGLGTSNGCQDHTTWPYAPALRPALKHRPFGTMLPRLTPKRPSHPKPNAT